MPTLTAERGIEPFRRRLYLPTYRVSDAARYARTKPQTVAYWHYRESQLGPTLPGRERRRPLSYMELIEVAFVAFFRNQGVSLQRIRRAREYAAQNLNAEYPFLEYRWKTEGLHLLMEFSQFEKTDDFERVIVTDAGGQLGWEPMMADKFAEFDYEQFGDKYWALRWYPAGRSSPVLIDPKIAFGAPTVRGIPTWVLRGRWEAGESLEDIEEDFGIEQPDARQGLEFEGVKIAA